MMAKSERRKPVTAKAFEGRLPHNPYHGVGKADLTRALLETSELARSHREAADRYDALKGMIAEELDRAHHGPHLIVSDHAVVRFIERFGGADMDEVRAGIVALIEAGRPEVAMRGKVVITVLPEGSGATDRDMPFRQDISSIVDALMDEARALSRKQAGYGPI